MFKIFLSTILIFAYGFQYLESTVTSRRQGPERTYYELLRRT